MENPTNSDYLEEMHRLLSEAEKAGLHLRLLGSLAFRLHCQQYQYLFKEMKRELTDIDFVGLREERTFIREFFEEQGYEIDTGMLVMFEGSRFAFNHPRTRLHVDVFVDKLEFCHTIDLSPRLELDSPTIPVADLFLEKMQIVQINAKDIKDFIILLLEHDVGDTDDREVLDVEYVCRVLSNDWGFCHTVTTNLRKVRSYLPEFGSLTEEEQRIIRSRIKKLLVAIEDAPKTLRWKLRSLVGTRIRWYSDVDDIAKGTGI